MTLAETIAFISPAIDKKNNILPVLDHVRIQGNYAIAYDGELAMCCPCELPLTASPQGWTLEKAVELLTDGYQVAQLENGDLHFFSDKGAKRKIVVPCTTEAFPMPDFNYTNPIPAPENLKEALRMLLPFCSDDEDENRPWINTILFRHGKASATSVHSMAWCSIGTPLEVDVNIPRKAVDAILHTKDSPAWISCTERRFVAIYSDGRFLSTPSVATSWPALVSKLIEPVIMETDATPLVEAMATISAFVPKYGDFHFVNGTVASEPDGRGASCEVPLLPGMEGMAYAGEGYKQCAKHMKRYAIKGKMLAWRGDKIEGRNQLRKIAEA